MRIKLGPAETPRARGPKVFGIHGPIAHVVDVDKIHELGLRSAVTSRAGTGVPVGTGTGRRRTLCDQGEHD